MFGAYTTSVACSSLANPFLGLDFGSWIGRRVRNYFKQSCIEVDNYLCQEKGKSFFLSPPFPIAHVFLRQDVSFSFLNMSRHFSALFRFTFSIPISHLSANE